VIFSFLKYVSPVWYFNLPPAKDHLYFPSEEQLKIAGVNIDTDKGYISSLAQQRDIAWRAFKQGWVMTNDSEKGIDVWKKERIPVTDEYRFIRKYYSPVWCSYILALRLISLKNPVAEINGFLKSRNVKRENIYANPLPAKSNGTFADIEKEVHKVSIIIPTLNRYQYLKDVLDDIAKQTYRNFEVIVVDQSEPFREDFYNQWSYDIRAIPQKEKALWLARNTAIKISTGDLILLFDDDSRVESDWIIQHIRCLYNYGADISSGVSISKVGDKVPENYKYFRWSDQVDTGNVMVKKQVFKELGLFDRQFEKQRMGDGEFGLRAYLAGYKNISNPLAQRLHLKVGEGGLRQMGSWDAFRTKKLTDPRPIPSVLYLFRKYYGNRLAKLAMLIELPGSIVPYKYKGNKKKLILGSLVTVIISPVILMQVVRSWRRSSKMLQAGPKIERL